MAFIDELTLHFKAGRGGNGVVRWRHEKGIERGGPWGGNGGKGGDVYAVAVRDIGILAAYKNTKLFEAESGAEGGRALKQGVSGADLEIKLPVGARVKNLDNGFVYELMEEGQRTLLLKGGRGGLGNDHFKSSTNTNPFEWTPGEPGEEADFSIELLLIVDLGLVGLPNAGKSSLLNALTAAKSKVGSFPFTTLEPNLGSFYGLILADIPGLIEGAAEGKGLGHRFLRHIERTKALLHCVSVENEDPAASYQVVRRELGLYNETIVKKPEVVLLTKADLVGEEELERKLAALRRLNPEVLPVSAIDDRLLAKVGEYLSQNFK